MQDNDVVHNEQLIEEELFNMTTEREDVSVTSESHSNSEGSFTNDKVQTALRNLSALLLKEKNKKVESDGNSTKREVNLLERARNLLKNVPVSKQLGADADVKSPERFHSSSGTLIQTSTDLEKARTSLTVSGGVDKMTVPNNSVAAFPAHCSGETALFNSKTDRHKNLPTRGRKVILLNTKCGNMNNTVAISQSSGMPGSMSSLAGLNLSAVPKSLLLQPHEKKSCVESISAGNPSGQSKPQRRVILNKHKIFKEAAVVESVFSSLHNPSLHVPLKQCDSDDDKSKHVNSKSSLTVHSSEPFSEIVSPYVAGNAETSGKLVSSVAPLLNGRPVVPNRVAQPLSLLIPSSSLCASNTDNVITPPAGRKEVTAFSRLLLNKDNKFDVENDLQVNDMPDINSDCFTDSIAHVSDIKDVSVKHNISSAKSDVDDILKSTISDVAVDITLKTSGNSLNPFWNFVNQSDDLDTSLTKSIVQVTSACEMRKSTFFDSVCNSASIAMTYDNRKRSLADENLPPSKYMRTAWVRPNNASICESLKTECTSQIDENITVPSPPSLPSVDITGAVSSVITESSHVMSSNGTSYSSMQNTFVSNIPITPINTKLVSSVSNESAMTMNSIENVSFLPANSALITSVQIPPVVSFTFNRKTSVTSVDISPVTSVISLSIAGIDRISAMPVNSVRDVVITSCTSSNFVLADSHSANTTMSTAITTVSPQNNMLGMLPSASLLCVSSSGDLQSTSVAVASSNLNALSEGDLVPASVYNSNMMTPKQSSVSSETNNIMSIDLLNTSKCRLSSIAANEKDYVSCSSTVSSLQCIDQTCDKATLRDRIAQLSSMSLLKNVDTIPLNYFNGRINKDTQMSWEEERYAEIRKLTEELEQTKRKLEQLLSSQKNKDGIEIKLEQTTFQEEVKSSDGGNMLQRNECNQMYQGSSENVMVKLEHDDNSDVLGDDIIIDKSSQAVNVKKLTSNQMFDHDCGNAVVKCASSPTSHMSSSVSTSGASEEGFKSTSALVLTSASTSSKLTASKACTCIESFIPKKSVSPKLLSAFTPTSELSKFYLDLIKQHKNSIDDLFPDHEWTTKLRSNVIHSLMACKTADIPQLSPNFTKQSLPSETEMCFNSQPLPVLEQWQRSFVNYKLNSLRVPQELIKIPRKSEGCSSEGNGIIKGPYLEVRSSLSWAEQRKRQANGKSRFSSKVRTAASELLRLKLGSTDLCSSTNVSEDKSPAVCCTRKPLSVTNSAVSDIVSSNSHAISSQEFIFNRTQNTETVSEKDCLSTSCNSNNSTNIFQTFKDKLSDSYMIHPLSNLTDNVSRPSLKIKISRKRFSVNETTATGFVKDKILRRSKSVACAKIENDLTISSVIRNTSTTIECSAASEFQWKSKISNDSNRVENVSLLKSLKDSNVVDSVVCNAENKEDGNQNEKQNFASLNSIIAHKLLDEKLETELPIKKLEQQSPNMKLEQLAIKKFEQQASYKKFEQQSHLEKHASNKKLELKAALEKQTSNKKIDQKSHLETQASNKKLEQSAALEKQASNKKLEQPAALEKQALNEKLEQSAPLGKQTSNKKLEQPSPFGKQTDNKKLEPPAALEKLTLNKLLEQKLPTKKLEQRSLFKKLEQQPPIKKLGLQSPNKQVEHKLHLCKSNCNFPNNSQEHLSLSQKCEQVTVNEKLGNKSPDKKLEQPPVTVQKQSPFKSLILSPNKGSKGSPNKNTKLSPNKSDRNLLKQQRKEQQRLKSLERLNKQLMSSDGFILDKDNKQGDSLFTDPSHLSREQRKLQQALIQFSVQEYERQIKPLKNASKKTKSESVNSSGTQTPSSVADCIVVSDSNSPGKGDANEDVSSKGEGEKQDVSTSPSRYAKRRRIEAFHKDEAYEQAVAQEQILHQIKLEQRKGKVTSKKELKPIENIDSLTTSTSAAHSFLQKPNVRSPSKQNLPHCLAMKKCALTRDHLVANNNPLFDTPLIEIDIDEPALPVIINEQNSGTVVSPHVNQVKPQSEKKSKCLKFEDVEDHDEKILLQNLIRDKHLDEVLDAVARNSTHDSGKMKKLTCSRESGQTELHKAARLGHEDIVLRICQNGSLDVNSVDFAGYTALHESAAEGHVRIAKTLLAYGANVDAASLNDGIRPIHDAVLNDHMEMVRLLLSAGADWTLSTYSGTSTYEMAHSQLMQNFLHEYLMDLKGIAHEEKEKAWEFNPLADKNDELCILPSEDEGEEMLFEFFSQEPPPVYQLLVGQDARRGNYMLLFDVLDHLGVSAAEFYNLWDGEIDSITWQEILKQVGSLHHLSQRWLPQNSDALSCTTVDVVPYTELLASLTGLDEHLRLSLSSLPASQVRGCDNGSLANLVNYESWLRDACMSSRNGSSLNVLKSEQKSINALSKHYEVWSNTLEQDQNVNISANANYTRLQDNHFSDIYTSDVHLIQSDQRSTAALPLPINKDVWNSTSLQLNQNVNKSANVQSKSSNVSSGCNIRIANICSLNDVVMQKERCCLPDTKGGNASKNDTLASKQSCANFGKKKTGKLQEQTESTKYKITNVNLLSPVNRLPYSKGSGGAITTVISRAGVNISQNRLSIEKKSKDHSCRRDYSNLRQVLLMNTDIPRVSSNQQVLPLRGGGYDQRKGDDMDTDSDIIDL